MTLPNAEELIGLLAEKMQPVLDPIKTSLVGIHTGGVWVAERLHKVLALQKPLGTIDVSYYRDDYSQRGLHSNAKGKKMSHIPFEVDGSHIIIIDDVLYTGRTIRAALNELFDYGRPARVDLAVLIDRGGRELPIDARFCADSLVLLANQRLTLEKAVTGTLNFVLVEK